MSQPDSQGGTAHSHQEAGFASRPPSQTWERISLAHRPERFVWVWFKPPGVPHGFIARIPDELFQAQPNQNAPLTMRQLLQTAGVDPSHVSLWNLYGVVYQGMNGRAPLLDAAIPTPVVGVEPSVTVYVDAPQLEPKQPVAAPSKAASLAELFEIIESDWNASLEIEKELTRLRKRLMDMMGRLKTLNRDLTPDERLHGSTLDKKDWLEARRWLREASNRLWRFIKERDIGDTSAAGQRKWFEQIYAQCIVPRQPFEGIKQAQRDFETYRKTILTLQINMNTAYSIADLDGERRAQRVLKTIHTKIREAQSKQNFLGVIID